MSDKKPTAQDRAREIADLYFDPNGPNEAECHRDLVIQINLALTAAREGGRREGFDKAIEHCQKTGCYSAVGFLRSLAAKEKDTP